MLAKHIPDTCHAPACRAEAASGHLLCWAHWEDVERGLRNRCWAAWLDVREAAKANVSTDELMARLKAWFAIGAEVMAQVSPLARADAARKVAP